MYLVHDTCLPMFTYVFILHRFLYTTVILPILLSIIFCFGIGVNIKNMIITIKNEEVNISDCQNLNNNGCIFDNNNNYTMSCVVLNYLQAQDYKFVSN